MRTGTSGPAPLRAGVAKVEITRTEPEPSCDPLYAGIDPGRRSDPLYVKALVLEKGGLTAAIVTVDVVALAEIGSLGNEYLPRVRARLREELGIEPEILLVNASHCHGVVCEDVEERTIQAVRAAQERMVPVRIGAGAGYEDRISQNRRLRLLNRREVDVRRAYPMPPDEQVEAVGPIDPEIGILRLDREDGRPLAVLYHFSCHPIQGVPGGGNSADLSGFASTLIEDGLGHDSVALFLQGCSGDVNPVWYKEVDHPRDAESLGNLLGHSTLRALHRIRTSGEGDLRVIREILDLPRAELVRPIADLEARRMRLFDSLKSTFLDLKSFLSHPATFVSGVSNGYLYYAPTAQQLRNRGRAQKDGDCLLAPEWQAIFEDETVALLKRL